MLIAGTLLAMGRLCTNDFTFWDDPGTVDQNSWLLPPTAHTLVHYWMSPAFGLYIPVTYTVWAAVACIAQVPKDQYGIALNPWLFHSANVLCHLLAVLVAYRILRLLNADVFGAVCGALLFGVHPIQVEAVAWVSGLKDVLSGMLALVALWQYVCFCLSDLRGRASGWRYLFATIAFVLALLAKPSAMALPLAALAIDHYGVGRPWRRVIAPAAGWIFIALPLVAIARWVQDASNTWMPSLWMRPLIVTDSLAFYAWKLAWPVDLIVDYGRKPAAAIALGSYRWNWIIPLGIAAFLITGAKRRPMLLAAGLIFLAGCLPVLGIAPAMFQFFSTTTDHYLYLSMFGPALALAWLLSVKPALGLRLATVAVLLWLIALTIRQCGFWQNDFTLFLHDTSVNPNSVIGYVNLGAAYDRNHDVPRAIQAFENATRSNPEWAMGWDNLSAVLVEQGKTQDAIAATRRAVDLQIKYPNLRLNWKQDNDVLGRMLFDTGQFAESIPYLETAADLEPDNKLVADDLKEAKRRAATEPTTK
jgi:tetratricopeptide (TPR) repeat protein